ncbi:MAG: hypothetical protein RR253_06610 [Oscillospiraceae bacterium]
MAFIIKTGTVYEPWHFNYVGKTAAKEMYDSSVCLEEYFKKTMSRI